MGKGDVPEPRQAIFDELGVARTGDPTGLYVSLSEIDVVDLISEGEIEGIVLSLIHISEPTRPY